MPQNTGIALFDGIATTVVTVFGEPEVMTLQRAGEADVTFSGVFDARHHPVEFEGEVVVSEYQTMVFARRDAVGKVHVDDVIVAREARYKVTDIRRDSEGALEMMLAQTREPD